jgi:hypothetical protein
MGTSASRILIVPPLLALLSACGPDSRDAASAVGPAIEPHRLRSEGSRFSEWSAPINLGPPVNTAGVEQGPAISKDGLSLYFQCMNCPGGLGGVDLWVSQRATREDPWGPPQNLGSIINTPDNEGGPSLSVDGHDLYFNSSRPGGLGGNDLYVARRKHKHDDFGWEPAVNLGSAVNSPTNDAAPQPFVDHDAGTTILYFSSGRAGGLGDQDIYTSVLGPDGTFGPPTAVIEVNSPFSDQAPAVRRDRLEMFLASDRPGTLGLLDLWVTTRERTSDPWSAPVHLGPTLNGPGNDAGLELTLDGRTLYFHSAGRPGNVGGPFFDIWFATRDKLHGGGHEGGRP